MFFEKRLEQTWMNFESIQMESKSSLSFVSSSSLVLVLPSPTRHGRHETFSCHRYQAPSLIANPNHSVPWWEEKGKGIRCSLLKKKKRDGLSLSSLYSFLFLFSFPLFSPSSLFLEFLPFSLLNGSRDPWKRILRI